MKTTQLLHNLGQSLWLDNITRDLLNNGTLKHYIDDLSVTGLTSNPTIFDHAIKNSTAYDAAIRAELKNGKSGERLFFNLAIEDLVRAADLFRRFSIKPTRLMDGFHWKYRHCSRMTRRRLLRRQKNFTRARNGPIYSSKSPARRKGCPRSKKPFLRECQSM